ncbi:MAG: aldehyde ferredoxin oxidoreductase family protein [Candidatus Eisenbacteria sp.]|nr:aldehyde ferredoxin oxidoreductase family protein [Candidatus Eisenbacteria bacterium]
MNGWLGSILHVDLTDGTHSVEHPAAATYQAWIGGKGLAGHYLYPHATRSWDAPGMPLIFMTGPLVGTSAPTSGRMCIMSRSPLTGTIGDASVGGSLGIELKQAGFDGIVISGSSQRPCGIEITPGSVLIREASALSGMGTGELHIRLKDKGAVATAGPAAESGVLFANIVVDGAHCAGRNGLGLLFSAKNLKYLTIKGSGRVPVHDPDGLRQAREDIFRLIAASPVLLGELGIAQFGTGALYDLMNNRRMMPTANFRQTVFAPAPSMNAAAYKRRYMPKRSGCRGCHILCKKVARDGTLIPEFETMSHFSALLLNEDIDVVTKANSICNNLGMDTISAAATLACYAEMEGERLSGERILSLLDAIGHGHGIGRELGQGSFRYAAAKGEPGVSISVKRQELPAYDPRGAYGMALGYATSTRGGCHLRAYPISHEILRKPVATDRFSFAGKARIIKIAEDCNAVVDSLTACKFVFFGASLEEYAKAFTAVTGVETTTQELMRAGERIYYNERIMNALNGFTDADDDLPPRFFEDEGSSGNDMRIAPLDRKEFLRTRARYYRVRGLDQKGMPVSEKAAQLGLQWTA